jgi:hypothetical protein
MDLAKGHVAAVKKLESLKGEVRAAPWPCAAPPAAQRAGVPARAAPAPARGTSPRGCAEGGFTQVVYNLGTGQGYSVLDMVKVCVRSRWAQCTRDSARGKGCTAILASPRLVSKHQAQGCSAPHALRR